MYSGFPDGSHLFHKKTSPTPLHPTPLCDDCTESIQSTRQHTFHVQQLACWYIATHLIDTQWSHHSPCTLLTMHFTPHPYHHHSPCTLLTMAAIQAKAQNFQYTAQSYHLLKPNRKHSSFHSTSTTTHINTLFVCVCVYTSVSCYMHV